MAIIMEVSQLKRFLDADYFVSYLVTANRFRFKTKKKAQIIIYSLSLRLIARCYEDFLKLDAPVSVTGCRFFIERKKSYDHGLGRYRSTPNNRNAL